LTSSIDGDNIKENWAIKINMFQLVKVKAVPDIISMTKQELPFLSK